MSRIKDHLFESYPDVAGFTEGTTSFDAAAAIEASGRAGTLRMKVRDYLQKGGTGTADEIAAILGENILSIRPRVAELKAQGLIEATGERHHNLTGGDAHVWRWRKPPPIPSWEYVQQGELDEYIEQGELDL